ncbi:MAG: NAD(P)-dependent oxidoreductase, partial [Dehalococcoidia bacterium]|nr:NAD(P)-dependent oxidoreductase [Dehalococcoidia bacterium]
MKALILAPFDSAALDRLRSSVEVVYESWMDTRRLYSPEELTERIQDQGFRIVVIEADFVFDEVFAGADKLRFLGVCRGSVDHVDIDAATEHGVLVVNTPARNAAGVAELTVGLMLSLARRIPAAHELVHSGGWTDPVGPYLTLRGVELAGKTAGIVGLGAIGCEVARKLSAFDMTVLVHDPFADAGRIAQAGAAQVDLTNLMRRADFITLHCPLTPATTG